MKPIHLHTQYQSPSINSILCSKPAFLLGFVFIMQNITVTLSLRSIDYPGNKTDHTALLAIKSKLLDPSNRVLSSWNDSIHHCSWDGVTCGYKHKRVTVLDLSFRGLAGTISPFIGNLSFLKIINFYNNNIYGEIPTQLGHLVRLHVLRLFNNTLIGEIPANISHCVNLRVFNLDNNKLEGKLPTGLGALSKLIDFRVQINNLTGPFFDIIQNLTSLVIIGASYNSFTGTIPNSIGRMQNLTILQLAENEISGTLPTSLFNISSLEILDFIYNQLHGELPADVGVNIPRLTWFNLLGNNFTGLIPITIQNLTALEVIELGFNNFIGNVPSYFGNFHSLNVLSLGGNFLEGDINLIDTLVNCSQLRVLNLGLNHFSGILPKSVANLSTTLEWLVIQNTSTSGNIPERITNLINLEVLSMDNCKLTGSLPQDFGKLYKLENLQLDSNNLKGAVDIAGNSRLCGGIKQLQLPKCVENVSMERKNKTILKLIIPIISVISVVLAMAIGLYLTCIKKKKKTLLSGSVMKNVTTKVSYNMLLKATAGFSSENLLGTGSFGSVFKGILDGKIVAVKVLNLQHHGASKSFIAECKTLRNVRHRNLVGIITVCSSIDFQINDFRALVYKFMPNRSLDKWLYGVDGNMNLAQRVDVAIDVAHALTYLHHECETPIVHCNLKPSNILLDNDMVAHVGDFGLARFLTQPPHVNQSSTIGIRGTLGYAAPEYGLRSKPSTKGDVYSYGILLLELITGKSPTDDMFKEGYSLHMHAEAALPDQVLQIVDPSLEEDNHTEDTDGTLPTRAIQDERQRRVECIISMISVGVSCSNHLPQERMKIVDARSRLQSARDNLLNAGKRRYLPAGSIC